MSDFTRMSRGRTTLYAAFSGPNATPVIGVYDFNRKHLETRVADRRANGEAAADERIVRCTVEFYRDTLKRHGFAIPVGLLP